MSDLYKCSGAKKRCRQIKCHHAETHEQDKRETCGDILWCDYADERVMCLRVRCEKVKEERHD